MNDRLSRLMERFHSAEAAADASQAKLRKRSAERLAQLLSLPPSDRLRSLADATLTPLDREQLEQSVDAELPRNRVLRGAASTIKIRTALRFFLFHRRLVLRSVIALVPMAVLGTRAVWATPTRATPVTVETPLHVNWSMPAGYRNWDDVKVGSEEIWVFWNGEGHLRRWIPGLGYALSPPIPESFWTDGDIKTR